MVIMMLKTMNGHNWANFHVMNSRYCMVIDFDIVDDHYADDNRDFNYSEIWRHQPFCLQATLSTIKMATAAKSAVFKVPNDTDKWPLPEVKDFSQMLKT